jgi:type I restriction enzyme S subunit
MSFSRYERYAATDAGWLGEHPAHWQILPGRRVFAQRRDAARADDEQLSATQKYGVIPQNLFIKFEDQKVMLALSGLDNFKHVEPDDFVISLRSFQGGIERSKYAGCVSPAYTVLRPTVTIDPSFWAYLLRSPSYVASLQAVTNGIRDGRNISYENFSSVSLPVPPLPEQTAIADFLDRETAKIDGLIAEQERLIGLLKEKRQAVISQAVTKSLDPTAPMKDSGVEWLGDVPAHWEVIPLRWYATVVSGSSPQGQEIEDAADLNKRIPVFGGNGLMGYARVANVERPVLVVGRVGALCGNVHIVESPTWVTDNALILDVGDSFFLSFAAEVLRARRLNDLASRTAQPLITGSQLLDQRLPMPPLPEQLAIAEFVISFARGLDALASEAERAIILLGERRSALISAAVAGKFDVRKLIPASAEAA